MKAIKQLDNIDNRLIIISQKVVYFVTECFMLSAMRPLAQSLSPKKIMRPWTPRNQISANNQTNPPL